MRESSRRNHDWIGNTMRGGFYYYYHYTQPLRESPHNHASSTHILLNPQIQRGRSRCRARRAHHIRGGTLLAPVIVAVIGPTKILVEVGNGERWQTILKTQCINYIPEVLIHHLELVKT